MADSKHTAIMANTWSTTIEKGRKRKRRVGDELVELSYGEFQHYYYFGRHAVDDNNNNCQGHLPFEEAYCGKRWDLRQLGFVIALAQTNAQLAYNYFVCHKQDRTMLTKAEFQRELARHMVYNTDIQEDVDDINGGMATRSSTRAVQLPVGCAFAHKSCKIARGGHELVRIDAYRGRWNGHEFPKINSQYAKLACSLKCGSKTRLFCYCNFNLMLCVQCYGEHVASINR